MNEPILKTHWERLTTHVALSIAEVEKLIWPPEPPLYSLTIPIVSFFFA